MTQELLNQSEEQLSRALGRALENIYVNTPNMEFDDLAKSYKEVEEAFLPKIAGNEFLALETKRRVAELMLYSAVEKQLPFELCQELFNNLAQLGFTNLEKKSSVYLIYSRYCLHFKHKNEGTRFLEQLKVELNDELRRTDMLVYRQLLQTAHDVLRQLRSED
jgi:hypothetical protein